MPSLPLNVIVGFAVVVVLMLLYGSPGNLR